ncbi:hypothetical protein ACPD9D_06030 [Acinetobacter baumannii]|uniref:hypothetical protein n=1 Tax=Acinetobacter baumannii TaxID=470 RepID=UPI00068BEBCF|nr:hypothetical protein [Acinetobacter baumannii]EKT7938788.1 hypothetical protein [Acinetobacter baumannii]EKT7950052.1 hypothetical protein [Acinetobacter baumannii]EKT8238968.1 hypothetical protein [Acinetobacter baumannii]EKT8256138.1 hypothetical protein [Acinetobacter baumannii]EKT8327115.1 hypothetical protein [Acinetobacter baumannii]
MNISNFRNHFLGLNFATEGLAQMMLDACNFDTDQNAFLPNPEWFEANDENEGVVYCCVLNAVFMSWCVCQTESSDYERHRQKAEEAITKGASLTKHKVDL